MNSKIISSNDLSKALIDLFDQLCKKERIALDLPPNINRSVYLNHFGFSYLFRPIHDIARGLKIDLPKVFSLEERDDNVVIFHWKNKEIPLTDAFLTMLSFHLSCRLLFKMAKAGRETELKEGPLLLTAKDFLLYDKAFHRAQDVGLSRDDLASLTQGVVAKELLVDLLHRAEREEHIKKTREEEERRKKPRFSGPEIQ